MKKKTGICFVQDGFTLIEAVIALIVLSVGVLSLQRMQLTTIRGNGDAQSITAASTLAADRVEKLTALPYADASLVDRNGDGAGGLDNTTNATGTKVTADFLSTVNASGNEVITNSGGTVPANTSKFSVYWNVADNSAVPGTKTIRVITVWGEGASKKTVVVNHVKANNI